MAVVFVCPQCVPTRRAGVLEPAQRSAPETGSVSYDPDRLWTRADVPPGPYLHGSRREYDVDELLLTDVVCNIEGEEDDRQMCFATISMEAALDWAYRRGIRHGGDMLYVYEVEMEDPQVDINMHAQGVDQAITSVMSPRGRVVRLAHQVAKADYPHAFFG